MKGDFSRNTFRPDRPYTSVRMQQGRVPLDADWNEQADIESYLRRTALRDVIGGCCIPASAPDSFRVTVQGNLLRVAPGRIYVGGRLCVETAEQVLALPASATPFVVYLEVFERHVTAIEDPDIREVALGGPDTATRTLTTCRARIAPLASMTSCRELAGWIPPGQTTGQMTALTTVAPPDTPCAVPAAAGYSRLENQLYRVEIHRSGTIGAGTPPLFKWSRDNGSIAAPWLELDGTEIVIPDAGRDDILGFQSNRWIELGHDALDLDGLPGPIVEVTSRVTGADGRFRLTFDAHGQAVPDPSTLGHPKVRRWDQDAGADPNLGAIPISAANTPIDLESGLQVSFAPGFYRAGDYWMIPARTFTGEFAGDILWPVDAGGNRLAQPPHGVSRDFCRLAIVVGGTAPAVAEDCRNIFPSLCGLSRSTGCCTVTVGPGGDVGAIAQALARLPAGGGEVCLLPGIYRERVNLDGRSNVTIRGCGPRARVVAPDANPVFSLRNSSAITVQSLSVEAPAAVAFALSGASRIALRNLSVDSATQPAIVGARLEDFALSESRIVYSPQENAQLPLQRPPAVFLAGDGLVVEHNEIRVPEVRNILAAPGGGIQIGGGSDRVAIRGNRIEGGCGAGILLGSVSAGSITGGFTRAFDTLLSRPVDNPLELAGAAFLRAGVEFYRNLDRVPGGVTLAVDASGAVRVRPLIGPANIVSHGDLSDVCIAGNVIRNMGSSGVTVAHFFDFAEDSGDFISVIRLEILNNQIDGCMRLPHERIPAQLAEDAAYAGVALGDVTDLVLRDNDIERNGLALADGCCGVFILHGRGLEIHRNRIRNNGAIPVAGDVTPGPANRRGGVVIGYAQAPTRDVRLTPSAETLRARQDGTPALRLHDNVIVAHAGRALEVVALGPVSIQSNQLTAIGADFRARSARSPLGLNVPPGSPLGMFTAALGGAVALVVNLGTSNELYFQLAGFSGLNLAGSLAQPQGDRPDNRPVLAGGNIQFNDNQLVLDALDPVSSFVLTACSIFTMDDLAFSDNQCDCDLVLDFAVANALLWGFSTRVTSNRFEEGVLNALYSAITLGFLNTTTGNQGTHCFVRIAPVLPPSHENTVLIQRLPGGAGACESASTTESLGRRIAFLTQS